MKDSALAKPALSLYSCTVTKSFQYTIPEIFEAIGEHESSKKNSDVNFLIFDGIKVPILPYSIPQVFENIFELKLSQNELLHLSAGDLKPFTNLVRLSVTQNKISFLEANLFKDNPNLIAIDLQNNPINFIDATAFSGLSNLEILLMEDNACSPDVLNVEVKSEIQPLIAKIIADCGKVEVLQKIFANSVLNGVKDLEACDKALDIEEATTKALITTTTPGTITTQTTTQVTITTTSCDTQGLLDEISSLKKDLKTSHDDKIKCEQEKEVCEVKNVELENVIEECRSPMDGTCRFKESTEGYTCSANEISIKTEKDQKVSWTGSHLNSKGNSDVESLLIKFQDVQLLPLEVGKTFTSLKSFIVDSSNLKKLKRNDFKTLENLEKLSLTGNEISSIESRTFDNFKALIELDLSNNQISNFPSEIFRKLTKLRTLDVSSNKIGQLRQDMIPAKSNIINFDASFNKNLKSIEAFFVWNLEKAEIIDFSSTPCNLKYEKGSMSFAEFFNRILYDKFIWKS